MKKIAVISAILEEPEKCQKEFNEVVASFKGIIRGRMGIPFEEGISVISITVIGELNDINSLTGKLGNIPHVLVKTSISKKEISV
ncbi:TM1266 family iron-only hydrogenase system putative regulator [Haloimpatiens sp. FM7330]|uniref:TM1266 family iron-only hydrogenase system putative regulator n=1 Tax=Haloimpatiens sp. FM7330 TaxID=3298610 RepID=UPI00363FE036